MRELKPCIAFYDPDFDHWAVWNEWGTLVTYFRSRERMLSDLHDWGYELVPPNSRCAATIRDKLERKFWR